MTYFNIPQSFVTASLSANIIFFYQLLNIGGYAVSHIGWLTWGVVISAIGLIFALYNYNNFWKWYVGAAGAFLFFTLLFGFYRLGGVIAANTTSFWVPSSDCALTKFGGRYAIPFMSDTQAVLIPIDQNNKMMGGILVKNLVDINCRIEQRTIGRITK